MMKNIKGLMEIVNVYMYMYIYNVCMCIDGCRRVRRKGDGRNFTDAFNIVIGLYEFTMLLN